MKKKAALLGGSAVALIALAQPAAAQTRTSDDETRAEESESTIIVTARKVEESIQDVPIAITAFSSDDLQKRSITSLQDIALSTPGFVYEDYSNGGYGTPTIRGTTQFSITSLEQNVPVFLDGIFVPRQYSFDVGTMTLKRVEVVKGPQSALYGANAFSGAINYVTTDRSLSKLEGSVQIGVSENAGFDIGGRVNVPLIKDRLAIRAAGAKSKYGGDIPNSHPDANAGIDPGTNGKFGGHDNGSYSFGISASPVDMIRVDFDYYHFDVQNEVNAVYRIESSNGDTNCGSGPKLFCGEISTTPIPGPSRTAGYVQDPRSTGIIAGTNVYRAGAEIDFSDQLSLTYIFGKIDGHVFAGGNSDKDPLIGGGGSTYNVFSYGPVGNYSYKTHEARLQYKGDNGLYLMLGGFALDGNDYDLFAAAFEPFRKLTPITSTSNAFINQRTTTDTKTRAIFGRINLPLGENLNVSAEGRYTDQDKTLSDGTRSFKYTENYFTPRFSIDYKFSQSTLVYASVAKGVKAGGVNNSTFAGLIAAERFYGPDTNWTYEIGVKNTFADGKGYLNADVFYIDWSSLQVPQTPTGAPINTATVVVNLGGAKSRGIEVSASYELVNGFTLDASLAYFKATFNDGVISGRLARARVCDNVVCPSNGDVSGNTIQRTSPFSWNLGATYKAPIANQMSAFLRFDVFGQAKQYTDEGNVTIIPARALANLQIGVEGDRWRVAAYAKNLFNKTFVSNAFFTATPFGTSYVPSIGAKRRIGVTASFDF